MQRREEKIMSRIIKDILKSTLKYKLDYFKNLLCDFLATITTICIFLFSYLAILKIAKITELSDVYNLLLAVKVYFYSALIVWFIISTIYSIWHYLNVCWLIDKNTKKVMQENE